MKTSDFKLSSEYAPAGDQPKAIEGIINAFRSGSDQHVLLGVTGSGKTFTMAHTIKELGRPTLIMAPNKTLAAQLFQEFKTLFPENAVEFFISYYDFYQPEAYVPSTDTYIAKDSSINDDIDKMRHSATRSLFERKDVVIVSSVSCIYGLGSPRSYAKLVVPIEAGKRMERDAFLRSLVDIQFGRHDASLKRGHFRVRGETVDVLPAHERDEAVRISFFGDEIESIDVIDALTGKKLRRVNEISIYPNSHYATDRNDISEIVKEILSDLGVRLRELKALGKLIEFQRLEQRVMHDIEMMEQLGWCSGIENYSRYLTGLPPGHPPPTLLDYFPKEFLLILDESHIMVPQIGGMYRGDRARKQVLVDYGFRLPSAMDNRPLNFEEFIARSHQILHVSATPNAYEMAASKGRYSEQIIRPTGLIDPPIEMRPTKSQVDDLFSEIHKVVAQQGRVLITTLTKRMAEDLTLYYRDLGIKVRYLHSDIDSLERAELLRDLRRGIYDVLIGINLLREGLDLPEVRLVAVMDADKEGFLRSKSSLIQIVGRAARNSESRVIFYADQITDSMRGCMEETSRRRTIQIEHNERHGISPQTIIKKMPESLRALYGITDPEAPDASRAEEGFTLLEGYGIRTGKALEKMIQKKRKEMQKAAGNLDFENAAKLRDELKLLTDMMVHFADEKESDSVRNDAS